MILIEHSDSSPEILANSDKETTVLTHGHNNYTVEDLRKMTDASLLSVIGNLASCKSRFDSPEYQGELLDNRGVFNLDRLISDLETFYKGARHPNRFNIKCAKVSEAAKDETLIMVAREILKSRWVPFRN